jgi:hypothetical protein
MHRVYRILLCQSFTHVPQFPDRTICGGGDATELFYREFRTPELMRKWLVAHRGTEQPLWRAWTPATISQQPAR